MKPTRIDIDHIHLYPLPLDESLTYIGKVFYVVIYSKTNGAYFRDILVVSYCNVNGDYNIKYSDECIGYQIVRHVPKSQFKNLPQSKEEALKEFLDTCNKMKVEYDKLLEQTRR